MHTEKGKKWKSTKLLHEHGSALKFIEVSWYKWDRLHHWTSRRMSQLCDSSQI